MNLKELPLEEAIDACIEEENVYMVIKMTPDLSVSELWGADAFVIDTEEPEPEPKTKPKPEPKPKKKKEPEGTKLDHGKIVALFKANWSLAKIADEMGTSASAISYHLKKDGLI